MKATKKRLRRALDRAAELLDNLTGDCPLCILDADPWPEGCDAHCTTPPPPVAQCWVQYLLMEEPTDDK